MQLKLPAIQNILKALLFLNVFMIVAVFRNRQFEENFQVDFQVILKLGLPALGMAAAVMLARYWLPKLKNIDNAFLLPMLVWFGVSCFYAPNPLYSLAAIFTFAAIICFLYVAATLLKVSDVFKSIIWSCTCLAAVSLVVYYVNPDFGRGKEWIDGQRMPSSRISGITGQANALGYVAAFCCLCIIVTRLYIEKNLPKIYYALFAFNLIIQLMTNSRSSLMAMLLALFIGYLARLSQGKLAFVFIGITAVMVALAGVDWEWLLTTISRTGDAAEILTGTGRTEIWAETWAAILQKPVLGWGYASAGYLMTSFNHTTPHAHNMFLQVWFMTGGIGLFLAVMLLAGKTYYSFKAHDQLRITLLFFLLIHGMFEPSAFQGIANLPLIVLSLILALPYNNTMIDKEQAHNAAH